jgi:hypothetical protein
MTLFPPTTWPELEEWLRELLDEGLSWPRVWRFLEEIPDAWKHEDGIVLQLEQADDRFASEIDGVIERLCMRGDAMMDSLSPGALALLGARIEIAYCWVCSLQTARHSPQRKTPVPFPRIPFSEFGRWLLQDWWTEHGRREAAEAALDLWVDDA